MQLSIAEPMNKKAASQRACPFHSISEDRGGTYDQDCAKRRARTEYI